MMIQRIVMVVAALLVFVSGADAAQTTYYVNPDCGDDVWSGLSDVCASPNGPKRTIQPAVDATAVGDTVMLADGTYYMTGTPITFGGKDITLRSANGADNCVIDGQGPHLAFQFNSGESINSRIVGISVYNCGGAARSERGGGISIVDAGLTIEDCIFKLNVNALGGAVYCENSELRLLNSEFSHNSAWSTECNTRGGALYGRDSSVRIENCYFGENIAWYEFCHGGNGGSGGGAIRLLDCESKVLGSLFVSNRVVGDWVTGGGAEIKGGSIRFEECKFRFNSADGAVGIGGAALTLESDVHFENCELVGNTASGYIGAGVGGALDLNGTVKIVNTVFASNSAGDAGGALTAQGLGTVICNSIFVANRSPSGSAITHYDGPLSIRYSYFENGKSSVTGLPNWGAGNIFSGDPGFVPAGKYRLNRNSPLIDAGDSSVVTIPPLPAIALDLDGNPRLKDDPGMPDTGIAPVGMHVVDIGCYEFQGSSCVADCDWSTGPGVLDVFDFLCFQNAYVSGEPLACDCDTSTGSGVCDIFDFLCFQNAFVAGCP